MNYGMLETQNGRCGMIEGLGFYVLRKISDGRGSVIHLMKKSDPIFRDFDIKEVYFSMIYPGVIKAWHRHTDKTLNFAVVSGNIKSVIYDESENDFLEFYLGDNCQHGILRIPPMTWNGFTSVDGKPAILVNVTDFEYSPEGIERKNIYEEFESGACYDWTKSKYG